MISHKFNVVWLAACVLLAGCITTTPATSVHQPMSARPVLATAVEPSNGAIYQAGLGYRPLFEDRRARNVGDILTINIVENTSADKKSSSKLSRASDNNVAVTNLAGLPGKGFLGMSLGATTDFKFNGNGEAESNNAFTGVITVTVIDVLANGNLVVSGEKQVGINQGSEHIRFSGVVNPIFLGVTNTVASTQVADARIEYRSNGQFDSAQVAGWLTRFFLTFLPF